MLSTRKEVKDKVVELRDSYPNESSVILETAIREGIALEEKKRDEENRLIERIAEQLEELLRLGMDYSATVTESEQEVMKQNMKDVIIEIERLLDKLLWSDIPGKDLLDDYIIQEMRKIKDEYHLH
jgi:hypothetical protein